jgi:hypothetical protein
MVTTTQKRQNVIQTLKSGQTQNYHNGHNEKIFYFNIFFRLIGLKEQSAVQFDFQ